MLVSSYAFYGWWDERFLQLLILSTAIDFVVGRGLEGGTTPRIRKALLGLSLCVNLGVLGAFKYFDFFSESLVALLESVGFQADLPTLNVLLPVGISFYTFQTLSYSIDVYRGKIAAERDWLTFAVFVAYFPQLVAGPIERASRLIPQLRQPLGPTSAQVQEGLWLVTWGFFLKIAVADNVARIADRVFAPGGSMSGAEVCLGVLAFSLQIYCDFAGYSKIARGVSKWIGIELVENFRRPYFSATPSEFWTRWHISLSSWLRDYLYIPLGGNRGGRWRTLRNLSLTMLLGGLWHGAAWTFVLWGAFHGAFLVLYRLLGDRLGSAESPLRVRLLRILVCNACVALGWLVFRAKSLGQIGDFLSALGSSWLRKASGAQVDLELLGVEAIWLGVFGGVVFLVDLWQETTGREYPLGAGDWGPRALLFGCLTATLLVGGPADGFIYFQF